jgi:hypothetical protein
MTHVGGREIGSVRPVSPARPAPIKYFRKNVLEFFSLLSKEPVQSGPEKTTCAGGGMADALA